MRKTSSHLTDTIHQAYRSACITHGQLDLCLRDYEAHVLKLISQHLGDNLSEVSAIDHLNSLHTRDLYLALACARGAEAAWQRFNSLYEGFIKSIARFASANGSSTDLADNVLVDLFLPGRSGRSRIGSYEGRSSLATWLRVVICHQAANERDRFCNNLYGLESAQTFTDETAVRRMDAKLRTSRYERMIRCCLHRASQGLTDRERLMLLMRYREGLKLGHIARLLNIHQSTVTRQIEQACAKMRKDALSTLSTRYHLDPAEITECVEEVLDNPAYSVLAFLEVRSITTYH